MPRSQRETAMAETSSRCASPVWLSPSWFRRCSIRAAQSGLGRASFTPVRTLDTCLTSELYSCCHSRNNSESPFVTRRNATTSRALERYRRYRGLYSRVARQLGVDRSLVSRVARGERRSKRIEAALNAELSRIEKE